MTERHKSARNRSAVDLSAVIPWTNESNAIVPAYGVVQLRTNLDIVTELSKASKPDSGQGLFFVNGMASVPASGKGESLTWNRPRPVLLSGNPTVGDEVGPVQNQWYMSPFGSGFRVLRQANNDGVGIVTQVGVGGGGRSNLGAERIWFFIVDVYCPAGNNNDPCNVMYIEVEWTDYTGGCDIEPPGVDPYTGLIRVYDRGVLEYYTADQLVNGGHYGPNMELLQGLQGSATFFYSREPNDCSYECSGRWIIDSIIGNPECNDQTVGDVGISS
jgi:hypothetical protein